MAQTAIETANRTCWYRVEMTECTDDRISCISVSMGQNRAVPAPEIRMGGGEMTEGAGIQFRTMTKHATGKTLGGINGTRGRLGTGSMTVSGNAPDVPRVMICRIILILVAMTEGAIKTTGFGAGQGRDSGIEGIVDTPRGMAIDAGTAIR